MNIILSLFAGALSAICVLGIISMILKTIIPKFKKGKLNLNIVKEKKGRFIDFKKSLNEIDLPVITLSILGKKFNFILDSGANTSHIDLSAIEENMKEGQAFEVVSTGTVYGIGSGPDLETIEILIPLKYGSTKLDTPMHVGDFKEAFERAGDGKMKIHGILGHNFFQLYKWKLDFEERVVWIKS